MDRREQSSELTASSEQSGNGLDRSANGDGERRLPFILRVAAVWTDKDDLPSAEDGQLRYWRRAPLTGSVASTSGGRDVSFSDLEVQ